MQEQRFEHHIALRKDRLCPFKITRQSIRSSPCNWHRNLEIQVIVSGEGQLRYDAQQIRVKPHDVIVVNPDSIHHLYSDKEIGLYCLIIDDSFCEENGIDTAGIRFEKHFCDAITESLCVAAEKSFSAYQAAPSELSAAKVRRDVLSLLIDLLENHTDMASDEHREKNATEKYIRQTLDYLSEHFAETVSLESIAANCGVSRNHLAREFKRYTGQTVFGYLNSLRCRQAEFCLSQGMTISETARESGFNNLSYFSRTYKKIMGIGPSESKKKKRT